MNPGDPVDPVPGLPWKTNPEAPRVICDKDWNMVGSMDTEDLATAVVEAMNSDDVDTRRELTRTREIVHHYAHRGQMSVSERQSYLDESVEQAVQPERYYRAKYVEPVRTLKNELARALDLDANPERSPEEALRAVREVMDRFITETDTWLR